MYRLREIQRDDIPRINSWRNNAEIVSALGAPFRFINQEVDEQWFAAYMQQRMNAVRCAIVCKETDDIVGVISLTGIDFINRAAQLHVMVGQDGQNKGAGTFAVKEMVRHGFNDYGLHRIELNVLSDNERAQHVYQKNGFMQEGVRRQAVFKDGQFKDMIVYAVINNGDNGKYCGGGGVVFVCPLFIQRRKKFTQCAGATKHF